MKQQEKFALALQAIDEAFVEEIAETVQSVASQETRGTFENAAALVTHEGSGREKRRKKRLWRGGLAAAAACLVLFVGIGVYHGGLTGEPTEENPAKDGYDVQLHINWLTEIGAGDLDAQQRDGLARIDAKGEGSSTRRMTAEELAAMEENFAAYTGIAWDDFMARLPENYALDMLYTLYTRTWAKDGPKGDYDILHDYVLTFRIGPDETPEDGIEQNVVRLSLSAVGEPIRDYFFGDETALNPSTAGGMTFTVSGWQGDAADGRCDYIVTFEADGLWYDVEMHGVTEDDVKAFMAAFAGGQTRDEAEQSAE